MLMAISFPHTVSSVTQFSDAAVRLDSASSAKLQAASEGNECGTCPPRKSVKSTDDDFEAMLAMMISGIVPQVQPPAVAESTSMSLTSDSVVTDAADITDSIQSQSVPVSSNQQSIDGFELLPTEPLLISPAAGAVAAIPEVQTTAVNLPVVTHADLSATPEALSQDAMDALERIGRLPDSLISQALSSALPENTPTVTASPADASLTSTLPVSMSPMDPQLVSAAPDTGLPMSATLSSVLPESNELKAPVTTPSVAAALSVTNASATDATESSQPSIAVTSDRALTSNPKSVVQPSSVSVASKNVESTMKPVRGRTSSAAALPVLDNSEFPSGSEPHAAAPSYEAVRSDLVQPHAANSLPDLATSISGEMRQPLSNQVSQAILEHIERNGVRSNDTLSVRLDPPELGEMTIELSRTHEGLAVRVTAREAVTMDMLFARGQEIESHLRAQQMNLKSLEFLRADMSGNQFSQGQQQNEASGRSENMMNQVRRGSRNSSPANTNVGRIATPESTYGLSFRA